MNYREANFPVLSAAQDGTEEESTEALPDLGDDPGLC